MIKGQNNKSLCKINYLMDPVQDPFSLKSVFTRFSTLLMLLCFCSCSKINSSDVKSIAGYDYYSRISETIKNGKFSEVHRNELLNFPENDSLKNDLFSEIAYLYYKKGDSSLFRYWSRNNMMLSLKEMDTSAIAEANWDLGNFYYQYSILDSAYYHYNRAYNFYELVQNKFMAGRMLLNLAIIQSDIRDYSGSEVNTVRSIEKFKPLRKNKQLYMAYNNLGIIYNEIQEFETSIKYHSEALEYSTVLKDSLKKAASLNNIGVALKNAGLNDLAVTHFKRALETDSLYYKDIELYAMLLDNFAHSKLLMGDSSMVESQFLKSLGIRDSLSFFSGVTISKLHLGEFHLQKGDTIGAIKWATEAKVLSGSINNFRDELQANLLLSKIDKQNSSQYFLDYINLNDSLLRKERAVRNKFERIRFETDEYIAENKDLNRQRDWMVAGSTGVLFMFSLLFVIRFQQSKNKKLQFKQKQQKANEEIYNLLLEQEKKIEEGGLKEKIRISRELHDGVLGKLFGVRFVLSNLNDKSDALSIIEKEKYLGELRAIEAEIRNISHDLQRNKLPEEIGFLKLIQNLLEEKKKVLKAEAILDSDNSIKWEKISNKSKMNLYRIIQESIQNTIKYAQASIFKIEFKDFNSSILLKITDNGGGFDVNKTPFGIGLKNIRERVREMEGKFEISSDKAGTVIKIIIPN